MKEEEYKKLREEFAQLEDDSDRWKWVIRNKDKDFIVMLDNDYTFILFEGEFKSFDFDHYVGWSEGVFDLLDALGVNAQAV